MAESKELKALKGEVSKLSTKESKELLLLTMYKLALVRSQLDAISDRLVKKKLITREELWEETSERFKDQSL